MVMCLAASCLRALKVVLVESMPFRASFGCDIATGNMCSGPEGDFVRQLL